MHIHTTFYFLLKTSTAVFGSLFWIGANEKDDLENVKNNLLKITKKSSIYTAYNIYKTQQLQRANDQAGVLPLQNARKEFIKTPETSRVIVYNPNYCTNNYCYL